MFERLRRRRRLELTALLTTGDDDDDAATAVRFVWQCSLIWSPAVAVAACSNDACDAMRLCMSVCMHRTACINIITIIITIIYEVLKNMRRKHSDTHILNLRIRNIHKYTHRHTHTHTRRDYDRTTPACCARADITSQIPVHTNTHKHMPKPAPA